MRPTELPLTVVRVPLVLAGGIAKRASGVAVGAVRAVQGVGGRREEPEPIVVPEPEVEPVVTAEPPVTAVPVVETEPVPEPPLEPDHVSEEPELVAEVAEVGAEDGAGAEVSVDPPWDGYDGMTADEIRARLAEESSEAAATVSLYEASRKGRRSVLEAAAEGMRN
jgi:hypothetical protein